MVTTTASPTDPRYRAAPGEGYDGVVRVSFGGYYATGTLLFDGRAVLTAAHLFEGRTGTATVTFETRSGSQTLNTSHTLVHAGYDEVQGNNDLALVWLAVLAIMALGVQRGSVVRAVVSTRPTSRGSRHEPRTPLSRAARRSQRRRSRGSPRSSW